ncbi:MAG TPA: hypothetical protein VE136_04695 [Anaerolineales bacterium]|jgi:cell wall-associated NlpC family hydrolase|nr:hypothetical protein [Anaerolineales bacterium]
MTKMFTTNRYYWKAIVASLLAYLTISAAPSAPLLTEFATRRADMLAIAERYATYRWTANDDGHNVRHIDRVETPDAETAEGLSVGGWWLFESHGVNVGIPYYWGGWTSVEDDPNDGIPDLHLRPGDKGLHFGEKLVSTSPTFPAGDVSIDYKQDGSQDVAYYGLNGVDCVGFVNQAWRANSRLGMSRTKDVTRPIRFEDLRAGDVLLRSAEGPDHVVLFKEFVNYEPASGSPIPGVTKFKVYEAALSYGKVVESEFVLLELVETNMPWLQNGYFETHIVRMQRTDLEHQLNEVEQNSYIPRTYLNPVDVVLVIDRSGSMSW